MAEAMKAKSKPAEREAGEMITELRKSFLDFSTKMKSPEFIVSEEGPYVKQDISGELNKSFEQFKENAANANVNEIVKGLPLGAITKLEILHFALYHTEWH